MHGDDMKMSSLGEFTYLRFDVVLRISTVWVRGSCPSPLFPVFLLMPAIDPVLSNMRAAFVDINENAVLADEDGAGRHLDAMTIITWHP